MQRLFDTFEKEGKELFLVGGAVRDLALGHPIEIIDDLDFCTNSRPQETLAILKRHNFTTYDVGIAYGTVGTVLRSKTQGGYPKDCQITTYRSEEYYRRGSRHPQVVYGDTIDQDLRRRDFSINSVAIDANGHFYDPYDGLKDLKRGVLRVVSDPLETLAEDPLRILRIARFMSKLGFEPSEALEQAVYARAENLRDISRERWFIEVTKLLKGAHAPNGLNFLQRTGILNIILPEVATLVDFHTSSPLHHKDIWAHTLQVLTQSEPTNAQRWGALLHDLGKVQTRQVHEDTITFHGHEAQSAAIVQEIGKRFKFDNALLREVVFIAKHHGRIAQYETHWTDTAVRRLVRDLDPYVHALLAFARADVTTVFEENRLKITARMDDLERRIQELEHAQNLRPKLPTGIGTVLIESFDLPKGPLIGQLKTHLEEEIIEGNLASGRTSHDYINYLQEHPPHFLAPYMK